MTNEEEKWHIRFMRIANEIASWSRDPSTKVGCVLVKDKKIISTGYNGFPKNISDDLNRLNDRDFKYEATIHAETNAIITAALHGISTEGAAAYTTFHPCSRCAAALINAGVAEVFVSTRAAIPERWLENFLLAAKLFEEAGVRLQMIDH